MKIFLLGGSGVAGRSSLRALLAAGHQVTAHARSSGSAAVVAELGVERVEQGDADDPEQLRGWITGHDVVVDLRVQIPAPEKAAFPGAWRGYRRLRDDATGQLVDAVLAAGVPRLVHDTVTFVYADGGDEWIDECHPVRARGALAANLAVERHLARLTERGGMGVALRFGVFYGSGDAFSIAVMRAAEGGRALQLGHPQGWTSAIHTDDVGPAVVAALSAPAGVYNVVDDEPLRRAQVASLLAAAAGRPRLRSYPTWMTRVVSAPVAASARSHRVSNARFKELGWSPSRPSRRDGWPQAFEEWRSSRPIPLPRRPADG